MKIIKSVFKLAHQLIKKAIILVLAIIEEAVSFQSFQNWKHLGQIKVITEKQGADTFLLQNSFDSLTLEENKFTRESGVDLARLSDVMPPQRRKRAELVEESSKVNSKRLRMHSSSRRSSKNADIFEEKFSEKKCAALFHEYATANDPDLLGPEGMEKFCEDIGVEPENIIMLVLAWKMDAKQMGFFTLAEWLKGLSDLQCDSIEKIQGKTEHLRSVLNEPVLFKSIYRYAYDFARDKDQRSMDMDTAKAMLQLLLGRLWPLYSSFHQFLEQSKYKVINKDQWCNVLEFSRTIKQDLSNYDEDGAWPVLLDEFVEWLKSK